MLSIKNNTIDFSCTSKEVSFTIKDELADFMKNEFYPKLEAQLRDFDTISTIWKIEHLPISITIKQEKQWKEIFLNESLKQIRLYLRQHQPYTYIQEVSDNTDRPNDDTQIVHPIDEMINYLETGRYVISKIEFQKNLKQVEWSKQNDHNVLNVISRDLQSLLRFLFLIPNATIEQFLDRTKQNFQNENNKTQILYFEGQSISIKCQKFLELIIQIKPAPQGLRGNLIKTLSNHFHVSEKEFKIWLAFQSKAVQNKFSSLLTSITTEEKSSSFKTEDHQLSRDIFYIKNAGLILLHPFLPKFFENLDYLNAKSGQFKSVNYLHRASLIMQHLIYSEDDLFEDDFVLNKILCGIDPTEAIEPNVIFTELEKELSKELLQAVISHWKILKNTSIQTLQADFLRRNARLSKEMDTWQVTVENSGIDVLLNYLPWGIGTLKTPWMKHYLNCTWV